MSDLSFTVEVKGVQDIDRLEGVIDKLNSTLNAGKGAGKGLEEVRKIIVGLKGQESVFQSLERSVDKLAGSSVNLEKAFKDSIGGLSAVLKSEMATLRHVVTNSSASVMGGAAKSLSESMKTLGQELEAEGEKAGRRSMAGVADGLEQGLTRAKTAAGKARAVLTAEYNKLVSGDGLKALSVDDSAMVAMLKHQGATVSKYHAQMVSNYESSLNAQRNADKVFQAGVLSRLNTELAARKAITGERLKDAQLATAKALSDDRAVQASRIASLNATLAFRKQTIAQEVAAEAASSAARIAEEKRVQASRIASLNATLAFRKQTIAQEEAAEAASSAARIAEEKRVQASRIASLNAKLAFRKQILAQEVAAEKAAAAAKEAAYKSSTAAATNSAQGAYTRYTPGTGVAGSVVAPTAEASAALRAFNGIAAESEKRAGSFNKALGALTPTGNDVHSMVRGLASGFNLLWLTWGNLAPLFAGAVISNGFMQTAKQGMEVAHTMAVIENIGGNTKNEIMALNEELVRLGNTGPFAPKAVAEAMQTLSLAGLKANDILAVTQDVLNFSVAGTTDIKTAADTLMSVSTAFGMGAQGFARVGDVISKAAAESKTSVEAFSGAMKTASVINAQYGVSLEDTATALAAMSQLGIEASAAGTALRNMYADLSGRSIKVSKILKDQGIEMRTATGEFRPMIEVVSDLNTHLNKLDGISQKNLMQALLSERGGKGIVEMLRLINTEAKDMGKGLGNALQELNQAITESHGFAAVNAANMAQTTKSLFEQMSATMQTTMYEAYQGMEPTLALIARELKEAFASEEFKQDLFTLTKGVAEFGRSLVEVGVFVVENSGTLLALAAAYKGLALAAGLSAAAQKTKTAATLADTAANTANAASQAGLLTGLGRFAKFIPGVGTAITLAAGAWALYDSYTRDSTKSALENARAYTTDVVKTLEDQTAKLTELNRLRAQGLTYTEAQARLDGVKQKQTYVSPYNDAVNSAIKEEFREIAELQKRRDEYARYSAKDNLHRVTEQEHRVIAAARRTAAAKREEQNAYDEVSKAIETNAAERREASRLDNLEFEERKKRTQVFGPGTYSQADGAATKASFERAQIERDGAIKAAQELADAKIAVAKDSYTKEKQLQDAMRSGGLISETEYLEQSLALVSKYEGEQIALLQDKTAKVTAIHAERMAELGAKAANAKGGAKSAYLEAIERESNEYLGIVAKTEAEAEKLRTEAAHRTALSYVKILSESGKMIEQDKEFWTSRKEAESKLRMSEELEKQYRNINTSILSTNQAEYAAAKATKEVSDAVGAHNRKLEERIALQKDAITIAELELAALEARGVKSEDTERLKETLKLAKESVEKTEVTLKNSVDKGIGEGARAGFEAFRRERDAQLESLKGELSDVIVEGLTGDADSAGKALRDILQREFIRKPLEAQIKASIDWVYEAIGVSAGNSGAAGKAQSGSSISIGDAWEFGKSAYKTVSGWVGAGNAASGLAANSASSGVSVIGNSVLSQSGGSLYSLSGAGSSSLGLSMGSSGTGLVLPSSVTTSGASSTAGSAATGNMLGSVLGYGQALMSLKDGQYGSAIGTAIGTYILPGIGTAIGSVLGGLVDSMFGGSTPHSGAAAKYSGGAVTGTGKQFTRDAVNADYVEGMQAPMSALASSIGSSLDTLSKTFGGTGGFSVTTGYKTDDDDPSAGTLVITDAAGKDLVKWLGNRSGEFGSRKTGQVYSSDPEEGLDDYLTAVTAAVIPQLKAVVPAWADGIVDSMSSSIGFSGDPSDWKSITASGEDASNALVAVVQQIAAIEAAFESLPNVMGMFADMSDEMKSGLLQTFGGFENLLASTTKFYEGYYSETERATKHANSVHQTLKNLGVDIDPSIGEGAKHQYRKAVEAAFKDGNSILSTQLLALAEEFDTAASNAEQGLNNLASWAKSSLRDSLISLEARLPNGGELSRIYTAQSLAKGMQGVKAFEGEDVNVAKLAEEFLHYTVEDVQALFRDTWSKLSTEEANQQLIDFTASLLDFAEAAEASKRAARDNLISLESKLPVNGSTMANLYRSQDIASELQKLLSSRGIGSDLGDLTSKIQTMTSEEVEDYFRRTWNVMGTEESTEKLVELTHAMLEVAAAADRVKEERLGLEGELLKLQGNTAELRRRELETLDPTNRALKQLIWSLEDSAAQAEKASNAFSLMKSSSSTLSTLDKEMGGPGTLYPGKIEAHLWDQLAAATSYEDQIALSSELTSIVLQRYQTEKAAQEAAATNAEKQLEFAKATRNYLDSLKTGNLSPLTTGQKVAEAYSQYESTYALASQGDADAQGRLQGASSTYLELARTYFASGEKYTQIFEKITSELGNLAGTAEWNAGLVLNPEEAAVQSYAELQKLYEITEKAYLQAERDYLASSSSVETLAGLRSDVQSLPEMTAAQMHSLLLPELLDNYQEGLSELVAEVRELRTALEKESKISREQAVTLAEMQASSVVNSVTEGSQAVVEGVTVALENKSHRVRVKEGARFK